MSVLAAGDDVTDLDLYRALPAGSIAIHVGRARPQARGSSLRDAYVVASPRELRAILRSLADDARPSGRPAANGPGRRTERLS